MSSDAAATEPQSYLEAHRYDGAAIQHDRPTASCRARSSHVTWPSCVTYGATASSPPRSSSSGGPDDRPGQGNAGSASSSTPASSSGFVRSRAGDRSRGRTSSEKKVTACSSTTASSTRLRYLRRTIYEYGRVLHELQLNAWVLAYRRLAGDALVAWEGETDIDPPTSAKRGQLRLEGHWSAKGIRRSAGQARPSRRRARAGGPRRPPADPPDRIRPHPASRQELRQVPPLRRLPELVVLGNRLRRSRGGAVRRVRLPGRGPTPRVHGVRRSRADGPPLASEHPPRPVRVRRAPARSSSQRKSTRTRKALEARRVPAAPKGHIARDESVRRVRIAGVAPARSSRVPTAT